MGRISGDFKMSDSVHQAAPTRRLERDENAGGVANRLSSRYRLGISGVLYLIFGIFLTGNLWLRLSEVWHYSTIIRTVIVMALCAGILVFVFPKYIKQVLFLFGLSFFLYGFHSYSIYSQLFEILVTIFSLSFVFIGIRTRDCRKKSTRLMIWILIYIALSLFFSDADAVGHGFCYWKTLGLF